MSSVLSYRDIIPHFFTQCKEVNAAPHAFHHPSFPSGDRPGCHGNSSGVFQVKPCLYGNLPFTLSKCYDSSTEKKRDWLVEME